MFDWLKQFFGGASTATIALSPESVSLLRQDLSSLKAVDASLPDRVLRYVLAGEGAGVLDVLRRKPETGYALRLRCCNIPVRWIPTVTPGQPYIEPPRPQFFATATELTPDIALRLAYVYDAASLSANRERHLTTIPAWLEIFIGEATRMTTYCHPAEYCLPTFSVTLLGEMLTLAGDDPCMVLDAVFELSAEYTRANIDILNVYAVLHGFGAYVARHPDRFRVLLSEASLKTKVLLLQTFAEKQVHLQPFAPEIVALAVGASKQLREVARRILRQFGEEALPLIEGQAVSGDTDTRIHALQLLTLQDGYHPLPFLQRRLAEEKSEKVRGEIGTLLRHLPHEEHPSAAAHDLPPMLDIGVAAPLSPESAQLFRTFIATYNAAVCTIRQHLSAEVRKWRAPQEISRENARTICSAMHGELSDGKAHTLAELGQQYDTDALTKSLGTLKAFLEQPDVRIVHFVRAMLLTGQLDASAIEDGGLREGYHYVTLLRHYEASHHCRIGMRELSVALVSLGMDSSVPGWSRIIPRPSFIVDDDLTWPYFAEHVSLLEQALDVRPFERDIQTWYRAEMRRHAFEVLAAFPTPPPSLVPTLWQIALGSAKIERPLAMRCLERLPNVRAELIAALGSGKGEVRAVAAEWLANFGAAEAVPALRAAVKKEKADVARAALLGALDRLGVPVREFLTRDSLAGEAAAGVKKGIPDLLSWFPFDRLPAVRWADAEEAVPAAVLTWWIVQQVKLGSPDPSPLLHWYGSLLNDADRHALAHFVLQAWLVRDQSPKYTEAEALAEARRQHAQLQLPWMTVEEMAKELLAQRLGAMKEKGMLALVAAFGDARIVPPIQRYLREWYGYRMAQCKALVHVLAWVEHGAATQALLAIATRFRTKGIREEAEACVQALAERKDWTVEELADRTIPTAGFEDGPERALDYGSRVITARLTPALEIGLCDDGGKLLNGLPDPRKDDDPELVKAAKTWLSAARKELKSVLRTQKTRLYEAMCTERSWRFAD
ncbi:MAG TPA: DUF4132 domain-containing protein, partial [Armatimonadota bacterium]|nr:DUF4132 domain-containing protein [Armatimonadota bacterium]